MFFHGLSDIHCMHLGHYHNQEVTILANVNCFYRASAQLRDPAKEELDFVSGHIACAIIEKQLRDEDEASA